MFVVGALAASPAPDPTALSLSRLVLGLDVGGATQTAPVYVAELAPTAYRGRLVLLFRIAIAIVIPTIVGRRRPSTGGSRSAWPPYPPRSCSR